MDLSFTSLGFASALPTVDRFPSAHILNVCGRLFLIDCGEGAQIQMKKFGISMLKIDEIFISHLHGDHIFGIFGLLSTMSMLNRIEDITIFAPIGFKKILEFFMDNFGDGIEYKIIHHIISCKQPEEVFSNSNIVVKAFPLQHRIDTYGYIFQQKEHFRNIIKEKINEFSINIDEINVLKSKNDVIRKDGTILEWKDVTYEKFQAKSFAYCSDTRPFPELYNWISGVNLLYHESTYTEDMKDKANKRFHSTAADAAICAKKAGADKLLLGHFSSRYQDLTVFEKEARAIFKESYITEAGKKYEI